MNIGLDMLDVARMKKRLSDKSFMTRVFTASERDYIQSRGPSAAQTAAGIFCAKEALAKASGRPLITVLRECEVLHTPSGAPFFAIEGVSVSITHTESAAAAVVLCQTERPL